MFFPNDIQTYRDKQKVDPVEEVLRMTDEYALAHKSNRQHNFRNDGSNPISRVQVRTNVTPRSGIQVKNIYDVLHITDLHIKGHVRVDPLA